MHDLSLLILWAGLSAGFLHVYAGADHMAALLPLSVGRSWRGAWLGARWGIGHSGGVLVVGAIAVLLKAFVNVELVSTWGERVVGVMLIGIGLLGLRWAFRTRLHSHAHEHDASRHQHLHIHAADAHPANQPRPHSHVRQHTAFLAGIIHGVAGTSHVLGVLPALALATRVQSGYYLAAFAGGTIVAMASFAGIVGFASSRFGARTPGLLRGTMITASTVTIGVGLFWLAMPLLR
ncbi:MAG: sulfite exporter TauE/SafE family protein [Phycisphaerae bacterium]|nr:sulfite exporter TauE/SafE family protein [Phycisphaerae bacterium]